MYQVAVCAVKLDRIEAEPPDTARDPRSHFVEVGGRNTKRVWFATEKAAKAAVDRASQSLRDLRIAEVVELDIQLKNGKFEAYRAKLKVSFKFEGKA